MRDGSDAIADWPILNALLNASSGATWVSVHHGGGVGIGYSIHAGMVIVAGEITTTATYNVAEIVRYAAGTKALFDANPNVKKWYDACVGRPAYKKMWAEREAEQAGEAPVLEDQLGHAERRRNGQQVGDDADQRDQDRPHHEADHEAARHDDAVELGWERKSCEQARRPLAVTTRWPDRAPGPTP